jgi:EamA-like transporter family
VRPPPQLQERITEPHRECVTARGNEDASSRAPSIHCRHLGWTFIATKILLAELGPVEIFALRLAIGLPFLGGDLLVERVPLRFARADVQTLFLGGATFTLHFQVQIAGLVTTTAINAGWIISVSPAPSSDRSHAGAQLVPEQVEKVLDRFSGRPLASSWPSGE